MNGVYTYILSTISFCLEIVFPTSLNFDSTELDWNDLVLTCLGPVLMKNEKWIISLFYLYNRWYKRWNFKEEQPRKSYSRYQHEKKILLIKSLL